MFSQDCAEFIKALGSFDYACANRHLMRISKSYPTVGSICSRVSQCEGVYSSMQYLKPKLFRREDHLYHLYSEISSDLERGISTYQELSVGSKSRESFSDSEASSSAAGSMMERRQGSSGHPSPTMTDTNNSMLSPRTPKEVRSLEQPVNLSPTNAHHLYYQQQLNSAGMGGKEDPQSVAADHIVLYTILHELCSLRMITIGVYRMMSQSTTEIDMEAILPEVEHALHMYENRSLEIQSSVLGSGVCFELKILRHGLLLDRAIAEYDVQISSTHLYLAKFSLAEWKEQTLEQDYADNKAAVKGKSSLLPNHYLWLSRWISSEKTKLTLYFMDILLEKERAMGGDERSLWNDVEPDLHGL
ncbi:hypothetical protein BG004_008008 [Podila humilis]|nr:hypothetical protein BG004_008008 [Podila humilis]